MPYTKARTILKAMRKKGLVQEEMAKIAKITQSRVSHILAGKDDDMMHSTWVRLDRWYTKNIRKEK